jgi:peptidoglycan/LPS O-acetylase OafA/YrhL
LLAVLALIGVTVARLVSITRRPLPRRLAAVLPVPGALAGACAAFAVTAFTHEILHYRWLFTLLGIVAAVHLLHRREEQDTSRPGPARTTVGRTPEPIPPEQGNVVSFPKHRAPRLPRPRQPVGHT